MTFIFIMTSFESHTCALHRQPKECDSALPAVGSSVAGALSLIHAHKKKFSCFIDERNGRRDTNPFGCSDWLKSVCRQRPWRGRLQSGGRRHFVVSGDEESRNIVGKQHRKGKYIIIIILSYIYVHTHICRESILLTVKTALFTILALV